MDGIRTKRCPACKETKPIDDFHNNKSMPDGKQSYCKPCWNTKEARQRSNPYGMRNLLLKRRYKMTLEQYQEKLKEQGGGCAICGSMDAQTSRGKIPELGFAVDHDHSCCNKEYTCGKCTRGLLCVPCNTRLGVLEALLNNGEWQMKAMEYLKKDRR